MITIARHDTFGVELPPPEVISSEPIDEAVEDYAAVRRQRVEAWNATTDVAARRAEAVEADALLLADSLERGEPDPGSSNVVAVDIEIAMIVKVSPGSWSKAETRSSPNSQGALSLTGTSRSPARLGTTRASR